MRTFLALHGGALACAIAYLAALALTLVLAACGQTPAAPAAPPPSSGQAKPADAKPAGAAPAANPAATTAPAAAQPAAGLTTEQVSLLFMGHVAGGANEQKAYDDILGEWMKNHP